MKRVLAASALAAVMALTAAVPVSANPTGNTGPPDQSCQNYSASTRPGNSGSSPGAPFNEMGINTPSGGTGGLNYSEKSQYDVACFQWNAHHT
jgi:hypothetical protein